MIWPAELTGTGLFGILAQLHEIRGNAWLGDVIGGGLSLLWVAYAAFWFWMVLHCVRTEPDRFFWLWLMIVVQGIGALLYFVMRYLPAADYRGPTLLRRWTRGRELSRLETAAIQIGNPHQFIQWADALRDVGLLDQAATAY